MASGERKEINLMALLDIIAVILTVTSLITSPMLSATAIKHYGNPKSKAGNDEATM